MKLKSIDYEALTEKEKEVFNYISKHRYNKLVYVEQLLDLIHVKYEIREKLHGLSSDKYHGYICMYDNEKEVALLEFDNLSMDEDFQEYNYKNVSRIMLTHHWRKEVHYALYELLTQLLPDNLRLKYLISIFNK